MKICRYEDTDTPRLGLVDGDHLTPLDLPLAAGQGVEQLFQLSTDDRSRVIAAALQSSDSLSVVDVRLLAPVPRPSKIVAVGLNYADHVAETGQETPTIPTIFAKFPNSITDPGAPVARPTDCTSLDYEGELAIVIGSPCRRVSAEQAQSVIGGYTILNDVSIRAWQLATPQWTMGKSFDTHAPIGPWVVLVDSFDPSSARITTRVNDEVRQDSNTKHLIFDCAALVAHISERCSLEPGDIISTGTPGGIGAALVPPRFLQTGDVVTISIEGIGELSNVVVDEDDLDPATAVRA